jgi:ABC-type nitrate/sulfonate/bicarbonate transport system ATPase subunit
MEEVILRLRIEGKSFDTARGNLPVLGSIDLTLGAREIVALVGPSGCGKTTLLRIIGGLDAAFQGTLEWGGAMMPRIGTVFRSRVCSLAHCAPEPPLAQPTERPDIVDHLLHTLDLAPSATRFPHAVAWHGAACRHRARLRDRAGTGSAGRTVCVTRSGDGCA